MRLVDHSRYKMFMQLKKPNPATFLVPMYDIDLVWHTHQLLASEYLNACEKYFGEQFSFWKKTSNDPVLATCFLPMNQSMPRKLFCSGICCKLFYSFKSMLGLLETFQFILKLF